MQPSSYTLTIAEDAAQGNPGALRVALALHKYDPCALGQCLFSGLVGPVLWVAYKDLCNEELSLLCARLSANPTALAQQARRIAEGAPNV